MTDTPMNISGGSPFPGTPGMPSDQKPTVPPPPPEITIRTMQGDVKSISETGGGAPIAKPFAAPVAPPEEKLTIPGYSGPEEAVFSPQNIPAQGAKPAIEAEQPKKGSSTKIIAIVLGGLVLGGGVGFLGYYFVYPLIAPVEVVVTPPPAPAPAPTPEPTPEPAPAPAPASITHASYFTTPADKVEKILVNEGGLSAAALRAVLTASTTDNLASGNLKEIYLANSGDQATSFVTFIKAMIPEMAALDAELTSFFEPDFTGFVYYDGTKAWSGYIAKLKSDANAILAKTTILEIEKYPESLKSFFIQDPGSGSATWRDGAVNTIAGRYLSYTEAGASLNYLWVNNYLVISTNYAAAQEAVKRLGTQ